MSRVRWSTKRKEGSFYLRADYLRAAHNGFDLLESSALIKSIAKLGQVEEVELDLEKEELWPVLRALSPHFLKTPRFIFEGAECKVNSKAIIALTFPYAGSKRFTNVFSFLLSRLGIKPCKDFDNALPTLSPRYLHSLKLPAKPCIASHLITKEESLSPYKALLEFFPKAFHHGYIHDCFSSEDFVDFFSTHRFVALIRDPRDLLLSFYRLIQEHYLRSDKSINDYEWRFARKVKEEDLLELLCEPFDWYSSQLVLKWPGIQAIAKAFVYSQRQAAVNCIKFEDLKNSPVTAFKNLLKKLEIDYLKEEDYRMAVELADEGKARFSQAKGRVNSYKNLSSNFQRKLNSLLKDELLELAYV